MALGRVRPKPEQGLRPKVQTLFWFMMKYENGLAVAGIVADDIKVVVRRVDAHCYRQASAVFGFAAAQAGSCAIIREAVHGAISSGQLYRRGTGV